VKTPAGVFVEDQIYVGAREVQAVEVEEGVGSYTRARVFGPEKDWPRDCSSVPYTEEGHH
jgi:hypothetical protein